MANPHIQAQRRIDVACGYALGSYIGVTLTWLAVLISPGLALFALLIAGVGGLIGTLRSLLVLPLRFWLIPVASLFYVKLALVCSYYNVVFVIFFAGVGFTAGFAVPIARLFRHDFARTIPPWVCKRCGYALLGLREPVCPECGEGFDPDKVPDLSQQPSAADDRLQ